MFRFRVYEWLRYFWIPTYKIIFQGLPRKLGIRDQLFPGRGRSCSSCLWRIRRRASRLRRSIGLQHRSRVLHHGGRQEESVSCCKVHLGRYLHWCQQKGGPGKSSYLTDNVLTTKCPIIENVLQWDLNTGLVWFTNVQCLTHFYTSIINVLVPKRVQ